MPINTPRGSPESDRLRADQSRRLIVGLQRMTMLGDVSS
jgi:hypothetical protein